MKKVAAAILLLVYFTVTTGFTVSVHYCMNKKVSVDLGYSVKDDCGKCGMNIEKSGGCCKDDVRVVKMQTDHNPAKIVTPDFSLHLPPAAFSGDPDAFLFSSTANAYPLPHGPPLNGQDTYLRNCVFRL